MSSHAIRIWDPHAFYLVSNRCFQSQCLLRPDASFNPLVVSWLRRMVRCFDIELYAAVVLGDRFLLIVRAPKQNLSKAMGYFQGNLARALNKARSRRDTVFPDRFVAEAILDDEALREQVAKLLKSPVSQGEVAHPGMWPGYTSWHQMTGSSNPWTEGHSLPPIARLPGWSDLDESAYAERIEALVADDNSEASEWPEVPALGAAAVQARDWTRPSAGPRWRRCRRSHACEPALSRLHEEERQRVRDAYDAAMTVWRCGEAAVFPEGTFPPGWSRVSDGVTAADPPEEVLEEHGDGREVA